jgi:hypothetical protein
MNPSREMVPLLAADVSTFCKNLRLQLAGAGHAAPSHVALLNMLARSAGYRNYQMLRAQPPGVAPSAPAAVERRRGDQPAARFHRAAADRRLLACFDTQGRLMRWPNKYAAQQIAIWAIWVTAARAR